MGVERAVRLGPIRPGDLAQAMDKIMLARHALIDEALAALAEPMIGDAHEQAVRVWQLARRACDGQGWAGE